MGQGLMHLTGLALESLRGMMWTIVLGFGVIGAAFYGGPTVYSYWQQGVRERARRRARERNHNRAITIEAAHGIAEIEEFLSAPSTPRPRPGPEAPHRQSHGSKPPILPPEV